MEPVLIRLRAVQLRVALPKSTLYALIRRGKFPRPIRLGRRCSAWLIADIDKWIDARVADSRNSK